MKQIEIFKSKDNQIELKVQLEDESVWLNRKQISTLFGRDVKTIGKHINNVFKERELEKDSVVAKFATTALDGKTYQVENYNLDVIISVGYRVKSQRGIQFRQWATALIKEYLVKGFAINKQRLFQKQQEVVYLKTGIQIITRAIEQEYEEKHNHLLKLFSKGLSLLDDYDYQLLDNIGITQMEVVYPSKDDYMLLIKQMYVDNKSTIFAQIKDHSFNSSINQIKQCFSGNELYPSLQEKAANLLYFIVKNHSFVDGNKRIAAACFLYFLEQNNMLLNKDLVPIISNEALAALTLFIASSNASESNTVKRLVISVLNRNLDS